jgi:hypothetical protein
MSRAEPICTACRLAHLVGAPARLCAQTAGGEIFTTELVRSLVRSRGGFELDPVGRLELKGLPEPVEAFRVQWTLPPVAAGGVPPTESRSTVASGTSSAMLPSSSNASKPAERSSRSGRVRAPTLDGALDDGLQLM